jgi:hypothetical protein
MALAAMSPRMFFGPEKTLSFVSSFGVLPAVCYTTTV